MNSIVYVFTSNSQITVFWINAHAILLLEFPKDTRKTTSYLARAWSSSRPGAVFRISSSLDSLVDFGTHRGFLDALDFLLTMMETQDVTRNGSDVHNITKDKATKERWRKRWCNRKWGQAAIPLFQEIDWFDYVIHRPSRAAMRENFPRDSWQGMTRSHLAHIGLISTNHCVWSELAIVAVWMNI